MRVAAVVVNFNQRELLLECLASLTPEVPEVVVVDNASADGSVVAVRGAFPAVTVVELDRNRGFGAGVNAGVEATDAEWILCLNNDATLVPGALDELRRAAPDATVGALALQMRFAARPGVLNSAGIGVDVHGTAFDRQLGRPAGDEPDVPLEVFGASAGAALFRRAMLEAVGRFDERFFLYLEDVDLAWRARRAGWRTLYVPRAVVLHHHAASAGHGSARKYFHVGRNRVRLLAKNMDGRHLRRHLAGIVAEDALYVLFVLARDRTMAPLRGRLSGLREWRAFRHGPGSAGRETVRLAPRAGLLAALRRRAAWLG